MRYSSALLSLGLLFSSLTLLGQQSPQVPVVGSTPRPAAPAKTTGQTGAQTAAAPTGPPQVPVDYILGSDDAIQVTVWKEQNFSGPLVVRPDGNVSIPLLGDVPAAGLTPMALAADIATRLKKFITDPSVTVTVTAVNSKRIYFIGEVGRAGPMTLTPNMTLLQAIASAGGLTPYANAKRIYILRGPAGKQIKIPFDYKKALKQGNEQGITLTAGDTVVVP